MALEQTPWVFRPRVLQNSGSIKDEGDDVIKLVLFHPAGTGATIYNGWMDSLDKAFQESVLKNEYTVQVHPIELPGRGMRRKESLMMTMQDVVQGATDAIMDVVIGPMATPEESPKKTRVVLLGHSLGGWIAFEVAREIQHRCDCLLCLIVSAIRSPTLAGVEHDIDATAMHQLDEDEFWEVMERRYGKNPDLEHPSIRSFMYPILQADFTISETYAGGEPIMGVPLFVSGGTSDVRYTEDMLTAWSSCTTSEIFQVRMFHGGHSYLFPTKDADCQHYIFVLDCITRALEQENQQHQEENKQEEEGKKQQQEEEEEERKHDGVGKSDEESSTMCHPPGTTTMSLSSVSRAASSVMTPRHDEDEGMETKTRHCPSSVGCNMI